MTKENENCGCGCDTQKEKCEDTVKYEDTEKKDKNTNCCTS